MKRQATVAGVVILLASLASGTALGADVGIDSALSDTDSLATAVETGDALLLPVGAGLVLGSGLGLALGGVVAFKYWRGKL